VKELWPFWTYKLTIISVSGLYLGHASIYSADIWYIALLCKATGQVQASGISISVCGRFLGHGSIY